MRVERVASRADLRAFCDLPLRLHPHGCAVPLPTSVIAAHARVAELFLVRDDAGTVVGRTSVHRSAAFDAKVGLRPLFGHTEVADDDEAMWAQQRAFQRSDAETVVRLSGLPADLPRVLRLADELDAAASGRAAVGTTWLRLPSANAADSIARVRELGAAVVLDAPDDVRAAVDPWGAPDPALLAVQLEQRKARPDEPGQHEPAAGGAEHDRARHRHGERQPDDLRRIDVLVRVEQGDVRAVRGARVARLARGAPFLFDRGVAGVVAAPDR